MRHPDPAWFREVAVGSIVRERGGPMRIVRKVSRRQDGSLWGITLVIRHPSWTGRATTTLCASDLKTRGFALVPNVKAKMTGPLHAKVQAALDDLESGEMGYRTGKVISARDVRGWP